MELCLGSSKKRPLSMRGPAGRCFNWGLPFPVLCFPALIKVEFAYGTAFTLRGKRCVQKGGNSWVVCCDDKEARMLFLLPLLFLRGMGGKPIDLFRAARVGKSFKARQQCMLGVVWCCAALQTCALVLRYPPQRKGREYQGDVTTPLLGGAKPVRVHT